MSNLSARIAITGANSFVGKSLRKLLYKNKVNVLGISRKNFGKYSTETKVQSKNLQEHQLQSKLKNYDVLVHLIGIGRETPKSTFKEINVNLTKNVIKTCKKSGIKKIIYISGLGVSKNNTSSYFGKLSISWWSDDWYRLSYSKCRRSWNVSNWCWRCGRS